MGKYKTASPRIPIKFIDAKTEDVLFEVNDRTWMNASEIMTAHYSSELIENELKDKKLPKKVLVIAVIELFLDE